jgi:hypothetical protein
MPMQTASSEHRFILSEKYSKQIKEEKRHFACQT